MPMFDVVYGQTAHGLAEDLCIPIDQAESLLAAHAAAYPGVARWISEVHAQAAALGEVRTFFGRRRYLPNVYSIVPAEAAEARRHAVNTIIQGTAADLLKLSLVRLHGILPAEVRMLLSVHDSVLLEVPERLVEEASQQTMAAMQVLPPRFNVPLKVDVKAGRTWAACKK
jgi:DNA polymerase I